MSEKITIAIEKTEESYIITSSDLTELELQDKSFDKVFEDLKKIIISYLNQEENKVETTGRSILEMTNKFIDDLTSEEIEQLPKDAAVQHDHYLYGSPKNIL